MQNGHFTYLYVNRVVLTHYLSQAYANVYNHLALLSIQDFIHTSYSMWIKISDFVKFYTCIKWCLKYKYKALKLNSKQMYNMCFKQLFKHCSWDSKSWSGIKITYKSVKIFIIRMFQRFSYSLFGCHLRIHDQQHWSTGIKKDMVLSNT